MTYRMRKQMHKTNQRAGGEEIPVAAIEKTSTRSLRIAMATMLRRAHVPMEEIVENGEWEDEAMARTYIRAHAPLAAARRNLPDVVLGGGANAAAVHETTEVVAAAAEVSAAEEALTAALLTAATGEAAVTVAAEADAEVAAPLEGGGSGSAGSGAGCEMAPAVKVRAEYKPCCPLYEGRALKRERVAANTEVQALLVGAEKPAKCQRLLCAINCHTTRKEIMNWRERRAEQARTDQLTPIDLAEVGLEDLLRALDQWCAKSVSTVSVRFYRYYGRGEMA